MSFAREAGRAIRSTAVLWVLTALLYPLIMIAIGQLIFPYQANGSLITNAQGQVIGSALIGQPFTSERYFNSRPSTSSYSTADPNNDKANILATGVSGASNLAPSNPDLVARIKDDEIPRLKAAGIRQPIPADLVYTSGSSLDPHISPEAARVQIDRVANARTVDQQELERLIAENTDERFLGIFGEPGVNVLRLNLALDALQPS